MMGLPRGNRLSHVVRAYGYAYYATSALAYVLTTVVLAAESKGWSEAGCRVVKSSNTSVTCSCDHLTNFAMLFVSAGQSQIVLKMLSENALRKRVKGDSRGIIFKILVNEYNSTLCCS